MGERLGVDVVEWVEEEEPKDILAVGEVVDDEADAGRMEETLVGEDGNGDGDEDDSTDAGACTDEAPASENDVIWEGFAGSHDPSGSLQSTLKELIEELAMHESTGASVALLLQLVSEYMVTVTTDQLAYPGL